MAQTAYQRRKKCDDNKVASGLKLKRFFLDQGSLDILERAKAELQLTMPEGEKATNDMVLAMIIAMYDKKAH